MTTVLTFAELTFLLPTEDLDRVRELLHLPEAGEGVPEAGLASLLARGHAAYTGDSVAIEPRIRVLVSILQRCERWIDLVLVRDDGAMSLFCGSAADEHETGLLVSAVAPGCFQLDPLDAAMTPGERLASVLDTLIGAETPGVMSLRVHGSDGAQVVIGRDASGEWRQTNTGGLESAQRFPRTQAVRRAVAAVEDDITDAAGTER